MGAISLVMEFAATATPKTSIAACLVSVPPQACSFHLNAMPLSQRRADSSYEDPPGGYNPEQVDPTCIVFPASQASVGNSGNTFGVWVGNQVADAIWLHTF